MYTVWWGHIILVRNYSSKFVSFWLVCVALNIHQWCSFLIHTVQFIAYQSHHNWLKCYCESKLIVLVNLHGNWEEWMVLKYSASKMDYSYLHTLSSYNLHWYIQSACFDLIPITQPTPLPLSSDWSTAVLIPDSLSYLYNVRHKEHVCSICWKALSDAALYTMLLIAENQLISCLHSNLSQNAAS